MAPGNAQQGNAMRLDHSKPHLEPDELYRLLHAHGLLPLSLGEEGLLGAIRATAAAAVFSMVVEGEGEDTAVLASVLTFHVEPGILMAQWIPEMKSLHKERAKLWELAEELRAFWFRDGIRRVEARVPKSRIQTIKALKIMGFRQETTDQGLRMAVDYGKGYEAFIVLGLLESDPVRKQEPCLRLEAVGVSHGE